MPARRIDLHTHSTASDGTDSPAGLVRAAARAELDVVGLTDHDTTAGWAAAEQALPEGLRLVRGAEISCSRQGVSLHVLGYLFDPTDRELSGMLADLRDSRVVRARRMVELLEADGHLVSWEHVRDQAQGAVGRPHVAQALVDAGLVDDLDEAFSPDWIGTHGRYWAGKHELDAVTAIEVIRAAGGVAVFAHPAANRRGRTVGEAVIEEMAAAGLAGLEVDHVDHDASERANLRAVARRLGLFETGSSDYHGTAKSVRLGSCLTAEESLAEIERRATGIPVVAA